MSQGNNNITIKTQRGRAMRRLLLVMLSVTTLILVGSVCSSRLRLNANPDFGFADKTEIIDLKAETLRPRPTLGVHYNFADPPNEMIFNMTHKNNPEKAEALAAALRSAGADDLRMSFHGYYSHLGTEATAKLKKESKLVNIFPWFPIEAYIDFIKKYQFKTVLGINIEEGPAVAVDLLERFEKAGALDLITSVELGNEPFLSSRPWLPEEYAEKSAEIIKQLRRFKVKFAVAVIVGKDQNTPTKISGDDYCDRTLATLDRLIDLKKSDDIYGAFHLYSRGVTPVAIDQVNAIVRKYSNMKYQITEYNIRLWLDGNPHLTNAYAMEFARKLNRLIVQPDIDGLWIHSFPFHSLNYWTNGRQSTVIGFSDKKLQGDALKPGWHLTPAGQVHQFYHDWAWDGNILGYLDKDSVQIWATESPRHGKLISLLNDRDKPFSRVVSFQGRQVKIEAAPYSLASYSIDTGSKVAGLTLPY